METVTVPAVPQKKKKQTFTPGRIVLFLMMLPLIAMMIAFNYFPLFGWIYSFFDYQPGISLAHTHFAGLKYFHYMIEDKDIIIKDLINTLALSFLSILASPFSVIFAILLNEITNRPFQKAVQTLSTLPYFISMIITYSLVTFIFSSGGLLNTILLQHHWIHNPSNIMGNLNATWWFQTAIGVWKNFGFGSIIYLAAIAGIDSELYDAAKVDGAGRFQRMLHVTVPGIIPTFFVLLLLNIAGALNYGFEQVFVFYNSLVADKIETIDYFSYRMGIATNQIAYGTAISMVKSVISIVLLFTINLFSKKVRGESVF